MIIDVSRRFLAYFIEKSLSLNPFFILICLVVIFFNFIVSSVYLFILMKFRSDIDLMFFVFLFPIVFLIFIPMILYVEFILAFFGIKKKRILINCLYKKIKLGVD